MAAITDLRIIAMKMPTTGTWYRINHFILSLYNPTEHPYSIAQALAGTDAHIQNLMLQAAADYAERGETDELLYAGEAAFRDIYPKGKSA
jgi:hypothetical protein